MRSSVPRDEKPACSAALAQSRISRPGIPGIVDGRPMPISMDPLFSYRARRPAAVMLGRCAPLLGNGVTTVYHEALAGDVGGTGTGQPGYSRGDLAGRSAAAHGGGPP